ncbi:MAG: hypothetical protein CL927_01225 [Deltaproteobacteria bacterium]|nr:hypothetical protein [Deltaproteobacteria bacterium]HCH66175.1 hypothetical protein [Deltaproteobacteria bacterium]
MRQISTWLLLGVVALVGVVTVEQASSIEEENLRRDRARSIQELSNLVALWEGLITDRIESWAQDLSEPDTAAREHRLRETVAWFDAYYLWNVTGEMEWPVLTAPTAIAGLFDHPCFEAANRLRVMGRELESATALDACSSDNASHELAASILAARIRLSEGQPDLAWAGLEAATPALHIDFFAGRQLGLDPRLLLERRTQGIQALGELGRADEARALTANTIRALASLTATDLEPQLDLGKDLLAQIPTNDAQFEALSNELKRAQRRVVAFRELKERLVSESRDAVPGELHIVQDVYSQPGFVVMWTAIDERQRAAVQIDASNLLRVFSETLPLTNGVYIADSQGRRLGPEGQVEADAAAMPVFVSVGLGRIFPHLHIAASKPPTDESRISDQMLLPLAPLGISIILGVLAVVAQLTAAGRERELNSRQQEFITRVTHELKTPLAGIRVMAETLQLGAAQDPQTRDQFLDRILNECNNLSARVDEVLSAARKPEIRNMVSISADELVRSVLERWQERFAQHDATLDARLDPTPPVSVDIDLMHDAIGNLLDNALKYRRPGIPGQCSVRTGVSGRWVVIEVTDNGIGVPTDRRKVIFERFTRVEGPRRGKAGGHGLGLAFVADTTEAHRGLIECLDGIDGGARFRIKLPRR